MNQKAHQQHDHDNDPLAPLDEQEMQWIALLNQRDADLLSDADGFVDGVMDRLERERGAAVLARIGQPLTGWKPMAAAAAVVLAGLVGWYVIGDKPQATDGGLAGQNPPTTAPLTEPTNGSTLASNLPRPEDVPVGQMIGEFSRSLTRPQVTVLPPDQTPNRLQKVLALFENPVEDASRFVPNRAEQDRG